MSINESVLSKLKKLMEHAKSAEEIGSMEEAQAFMTKVNKLLIQHKLDMAEVETFDSENMDDSIESERFDPFENGIPHLKKRVQWQEQLASVIAKNHNCKTLVQTASNNIYFVGRSRDRQVCSYVYAYAVRSAIGHSNNEYRRLYTKFYKIGEKEQMIGWIPAFFRGFNLGVRERFDEMHAELKDEVGDKRYALVTIDQRVAVAKYVKEMFGVGRANGLGGMSGSNEHGHKAGHKFGKSMNFGQKGVTRGQTRQLGA
jgi:hypothetical protein